MIAESARDGRRTLFGYSYATESADQIAALATAEPNTGQQVRLIVTTNLDHIVQLRQNEGLRHAYDRAWRRTIDGAPVFLYSKLRGIGIEHRITGADLVPGLMNRLVPDAHFPFFVVASPVIAAGLREWTRSHGFSDEACGIEVPPFGFEKDERYGDELAAKIRANGTTQLFFGVGCPKSEIWIVEHADRLGDCYAFAVGAALGFFVGTQRRAPSALRRFGLEWLWRVYQEPKRLARRYFVDSWSFVGAMFDDLRAAGSHRR
jgi:N-acetylglucosaminyldiphosphoundecaprenol N-acetyl-beta-D-mannosaminyltransferase